MYTVARILVLLAATAAADDLGDIDESVTELAFGAQGEARAELDQHTGA